MARKSLLLILLLFSLTCSGENNVSFRRLRIRNRRESQKMNGECDPPEIENGKFKLLNNPDYDVGSPIPQFSPLEISCKKYYALVPETSKNPVCINSNWSVSLPKCIRTCRPLVSPYADVNCTSNGIPVDCTQAMLDGTVATSRCKRFYTLTDSTQFPTTTCRDGSWDSDRPLVRCMPDCGEVASEGVVNVVNGEKVKQGEFPWHIALYRYDNETQAYKYQCGGSIITPNIVITAAHCLTNVAGERYPAEEYQIGAGKYYSSYYASNDTSAQKRQVKDYYIPPEYKAKVLYYTGDLAVIVVDKAFDLTNYVRPVCIDWQVQFERDQLFAYNGSVTGWGFVDTKEKMISTELRKLTGPYIDTKTCYNTVPPEFQQWITTDKFCAGYTNGTSVCEGDSGGGMVFPWVINNKQKYYLRGVVSGGPTKEGTCDEHYYGVYTRISKYTGFIREIVHTHTEKDSRTYGTGYGYCSEPEPEIMNGKFVLLNSKYEEGFPIPNYSFLAVYCDENYRLYPKVPYVFCTNGTWNAPIPECKKTCPYPYFVQNCKMNDIEIPCYEAAIEGAEVQSRCDTNITSKCIDGTWSTPLPTCGGGGGGGCGRRRRRSPISCHLLASLTGAGFG